LGLSKKSLLKFSFFFLLLLSLMAAWLGFGERGLVHLFQMEKDRTSHLERIGRLERENKELLEEIQRLRTDQEYIESTGRREFGLIKNDEILYRFDRNEKSPRPEPKPKKKEDTKK
jgi:cell division protein FtsB